MSEKVNLSELPDDAFVYQEDEHVMRASELREYVKHRDEERTQGWLVGIPTSWTPDARDALERHVNRESENLYEDAYEVMWDEIEPLIGQIQAILDGVKVPYYEPGADVVIDIEPDDTP